MTPAERATAERATAERIDSTYIIRDWWRVTRPGEAEFEVWLLDGITQSELLARYPGAALVPL